MAALVLDLPPELYARLRAEAERQGKPLEGIVQEWLNERLELHPTPVPSERSHPPHDRERSIAAMRAVGLVAEPSPAQRARAAHATMTLEEVSAALDRSEGKPLSEIILEQRGPKV
ncbi:MAG TPA: hypothetical protein VIL85_11295 [Thermomicrobiales bacterium]|jgi:hypothetical protein